MNIAWKYLGLLTRQFRNNPDGYLCLTAMKQRSVKEKWYHPREELRPLIDWATRLNRDGYNIYATWALFARRERKIDACRYSAAWVADWDNGEPKTLPSSTPTLVVQTSPGRWQHIYVHEPATVGEARNTYKRLCQDVIGVDKGPSADAVHMWRVPGFVNYPKPEKNRPPSVATWDGKVNGKATIDFSQLLSPTFKSEIHTRRKGRALSPWMKRLIDRNVPVGERSEQFHKLVIGIAKLGWGVQDIADMLKNSWAGEKFGDRLAGEIERSLEKSEIADTREYNLIEYNPEDIEERIHWLWWPYIPLNEVTLLDGDGGVGKTAMMLRITRELIEGGKMPNGQQLPGGKRVLFISTESNYERVTLPLLKRMGTRRRSHFYHMQDPEFVLDDAGIDSLSAIIKHHQLRLVVIDPVAQFLPQNLEMNNYQHSVYIMSRLQAVSSECACAIVLVRHNAKGQRDQLGQRGIGSIGWQSSCRSQLVVRHDPEDEDQYIVVPTKHQHASKRDARSFLYEWKTVEDRGVIEWAGLSELSAEEVNEAKLDPKEARGKKKEVLDWLREYLRERRASTDVYTQAEARGYNHKAIYRASQELGVVKSERQGVKDGKGGTIAFWSLPSASGVQ